MREDKATRKFPAWLAWPGLFLLCLLILSEHAAFFRAHHDRLAGVNAPDYLMQSAVIAHVLTNDPSRGFAPGALTAVSYKPPLFAAVAGALAAVLGKNLAVFNFAGTLFLVLLVIAVFLIGRRLHGPGWGLVAAFLVACLPAIEQASLDHTPEIAQAALVAWTVAFLLAGGPRWALPAGLAAGLAMLARGTAFAYFLPPLLVVLLAHVRGSQQRWRDGLRFVGLFLVGLFAAAGPWYVPRLGRLAHDLSYHLFDFFSKYETGHTETGRFFLYELWLANGPVFTTLFGLGLVGLFVGKRPGRAVLTAWLFVPLVAFAIAPADITRFLLPTFAVLALVIAGGLSAVRPRAVAATLTALVLLFGLVQREAISRQWELRPTRFHYAMKTVLVMPRMERDWGALEAGIAQLASHVQSKRPHLLGVIDFGRHDGPPIAMVKVLWSIHAPLQRTVNLERKIATPFALKVFVRTLPGLDYLLASVPVDASAWPDAQALDELLVQRGPLQQRDYDTISVAPFAKVLAEQQPQFVEQARVSVPNGDEAGFDLVLLMRRDTPTP